MAKGKQYETKQFHLRPINGLMDQRSSPDQVKLGGYSFVRAFEATDKNKVCRMPGWRKIEDSDSYGNQDLHDQLLLTALAGEWNIRQPIVFLYEAQDSSNINHLFAATQNRLYSKIQSTGNWKLIWDTLTDGATAPGGAPVSGLSGVIWSAGCVNDTIIFTNGVDMPVYHVIDQPAMEANDQSVSVIDDLVDFGITRAGFCSTWNNLLLLFDVTMDGRRRPNRIIWSDYKAPLSFRQSKSSLAGQKDLDNGEIILSAKALGNVLLIYTNRGIWEATAVGGESVLSFVKRYEADRRGSRTLAFPRTLVSDGTSHWYMGRDGIYKYDFYTIGPERVEWIHEATSVIYDDLNLSNCAMQCGGYNHQKKTLWFSWGKSSDQLPTDTITINLEYPFMSTVGHGFTAFCNFGPQDVKSLRDWMIENCICSPAEISEDTLIGLIKEGEICETETQTCVTNPDSIYTTDLLTDPDDPSIESEDYIAESASANSLCALLGETPIDDCASEVGAGQCNPSDLFIMASAEDWCIKEASQVYYREMCSIFQGCNTASAGYVRTGYKSVLRSAAVDLAMPENDKTLMRFSIEAFPAIQTIPSEVQLRVGTAGQAVDPNNETDRCFIMWQDQDPQSLDCLSQLTLQESVAEGTRPDGELSWLLYMTGRCFYYEMTIANPDSAQADTGGQCCLSRFTFHARVEKRDFY